MGTVQEPSTQGKGWRCLATLLPGWDLPQGLQGPAPGTSAVGGREPGAVIESRTREDAILVQMPALGPL